MSKADKRKRRAVQAAAGRLTDLQWSHVRQSSFIVGAGYLVDRRLRLPSDMVEPYSPAKVRLTDPFGIAVRDAVIRDATRGDAA